MERVVLNTLAKSTAALLPDDLFASLAIQLPSSSQKPIRRLQPCHWNTVFGSGDARIF